MDFATLPNVGTTNRAGTRIPRVPVGGGEGGGVTGCEKKEGLLVYFIYTAVLNILLFNGCVQ